MLLYLVHHADAVSPAVDHMRPLSEDGRRQAEAVAGELKARGARPDLVWHSGKLRARQTAQACWSALNPMAAFTAVRGLQPDEGPDQIWAALEDEDREVLVVGHLPSLPKILYRLTTNRHDGGSADFPPHGAVALERTGERWVESWRVVPSLK